MIILFIVVFFVVFINLILFFIFVILVGVWSCYVKYVCRECFLLLVKSGLLLMVFLSIFCLVWLRELLIKVIIVFNLSVIMVEINLGEGEKCLFLVVGNRISVLLIFVFIWW